MHLSRQDSLNNLQFVIVGGVNASTRDSVLDGVLEQNVWLTIVGSYRASTQQYWLTVNNVLGSSGTASGHITDKTSTASRLGNTVFTGDMAGVFVVDEYLSTDATSAIADSMVQGVDLITLDPGNDELSDCIGCVAGKYSVVNGSSSVAT